MEWFQFPNGYREYFDCHDHDNTTDLNCEDIIESFEDIRSIEHVHYCVERCHSFFKVKQIISEESIRQLVNDALDQQMKLNIKVNRDVMVQGNTIMKLYDLAYNRKLDRFEGDTDALDLDIAFVFMIMLKYILALYRHHIETGEPTILYTDRRSMKDISDFDCYNTSLRNNNTDMCPLYLDIPTFFQDMFIDPMKRNRSVLAYDGMLSEIKNQTLSNLIIPILDEYEHAFKHIQDQFMQLFRKTNNYVM